MTKQLMQALDDEFCSTDQPKQYTESDYQELQRNLILYKQGNAEAVTYIVKMFHKFITKYARFVVLGHLPYYEVVDKKGITRHKIDASITQFVTLFIDKNDKQEYSRQKLFSVTCTKIKTLFSKYEYGDIYNELVLALLNMANKYKITQEGDTFHKKNGTFHMYISKCFHWEAYRYLSKLVTDPLSHFEVVHLCDQFYDMDLEENPEVPETFIEDENARLAYDEMLEIASRESDIQNSTTLTMKESEPLSIYDTDILNFNWTNGVTCSNLFADLTPYEREIILLSYVKNKTDIEIGNIYGCHRATINIHKKRAVEKIKARALEQNIIS